MLRAVWLLVKEAICFPTTDLRAYWQGLMQARNS